MSFFHPTKSKIDILLLIATLLFAIIEFLGDGFTFFIQNSRCFTFLGCNAGFFGYDALIHISGGIFFSILLVWLMRRYPRFDILHNKFWKSILVLLALITFISTVWEIYEFALDHFDILSLHTNGSYIDTLAQPGLSDTIGDFFFELLGAIIGTFLLRVFAPQTLVSHHSHIETAPTYNS